MNQGICARLAGGVVIPGRALIVTLPLVRQVVVVPAVWQFGSALATGADNPAATARPATSMATVPCGVIERPPFGLRPGCVPITGRPR